MDLNSSAEQPLLRENIRRFVKSEISPLIVLHETNRSFPLSILKALGSCRKN